MALSPFVFIGVGGSGGKTLRVVRDVLSSTLTSIGWSGDFPKAWQFLHIDVPATPDGIEPGLPFTLPLSDYVGMTTPQSTYRSVDRQVNGTNRSGIDHYLAWDSWRPYPPEQVPVKISLGAGQARAIGRVALLNNLKEVGSRVAIALSNASSADTADLVAIQKMWGKESGGTDKATRTPTVMIVSSISGGSGSGGLLDVCDVVRSYNSNEQTNIFSVVYAPEVFEDDQGRLEPGIAPNTFVALNELINAWWVRGGEDLPLSREVHFSRSSVNPHRERTGPDGTFIVGRRNANVTLGNRTEIYRVMGRSLAELALSEAQQDGLGAYSVANGDARSQAIAHTVPVAPTSQTTSVPIATNLYALGFARLTVGRELFHEYAAERLAREAVVRLREAHRTRSADQNAKKTDEELTQEQADKRWAAFLRDSHLSERGYSDNAVIEAILPPGELQSLLKTWAHTTLGKIAEAGRGGALSIDDARGQVRDEILESMKPDGIYPGFLAKLRERAIEWRRGSGRLDPNEEQSIHRWLADHVANELALSGVKVTRRLLEMLEEDLVEAKAELEAESAQRRADGNLQLSAIADRKANDPRKADVEAGGYVDRVLVSQEGYQAMNQLYYAEAVTIAAALVSDVITHLVTPLRLGLADADELLTLEVEPISGQTSDFAEWPGTNDIPDHLRPSKVERTLDDVEAFPTVLLDLLQTSTGTNTPDQAVSAAVEEIIRGARLVDHYRAPRPYSYRSLWIPEQESLRAPNESGASANFSVHITLDDLLQRSRSWLADTQKEVGRHIHQSMEEYIGDKKASSAELLRRRERLIGEFREMLRLAQPLVKIDTDTLQLAHGIDRPEYELVMSALNIPSSDRALRAELEEVAQGVLGAPTKIKVGKQRTGTQVMTTLKQPLHPVALYSIMEPIYTQWDSDHTGRDFWKYRRARPLLEWVPLAPASQRALVQGWLLARLLGYAHAVQDPHELTWSVRVRTVRSARRTEWVTLPTTGPRPISPEDALGNVFELVAMSSLEVYRSKSLEALQPFQTLVNLGAAPWEQSRLAAWISTGDGLDADGSPLLGEVAADDRAEHVIDRLDGLATTFRALTKEPESDENIAALQQHPAIEVAELALDVIADLKATVTESRKKHHGGLH